MISVLTLQYEVQKQLNRIHTSLKKDVSAVDIDAAINKAKDYILERYSDLAEKNLYFENALKELEVFEKPLVKTKAGLKYDFFKLPDDYYRYLRVSAEGSCETCKEIKSIKTIDFMQQDDINEYLKDPFKSPSWNWRRGFINFTQDGLMFYHNNKYKIENLNLSYIKYVEDVAAPSLVNGNTYLKSDMITVVKNDQHLNLNPKNSLWRKIVDMAAIYIKKDLDDNFQGDVNTYLFSQNAGVN